MRATSDELLRAMLNADLIGFLLFGCRVTLATLHHLAMPPLATLAPPYILYTITTLRPLASFGFEQRRSRQSRKRQPRLSGAPAERGRSGDHAAAQCV